LSLPTDDRDKKHRIAEQFDMFSKGCRLVGVRLPILPTSCQFGLGVEAKVCVPVAKIVLQRIHAEPIPTLAAIRPERNAPEKAGFSARLQKPLDRCTIRQLAQVMRCDVGILPGAMRRQPEFVDQAFGSALIP